MLRRSRSCDQSSQYSIIAHKISSVHLK
ncbi:unnamed protein product [Linum tenue]|uniref:Uncharacterized protein n=1 Tax=Linum tenue TaxID=586396 RepID=A0AAV0J242_9ROSI|nr:unnamed protein product [Linum tenue]